MRQVGVAAAALLLVGGCAPASLGEPAASLRNVQLIRNAHMGPLAVGTFAPDPALPPRADRFLDIRASGLRPPSGDTFSGYLGVTLAAQLKAAGVLDPRSATAVSGRLAANRIGSGIGTGHGELAAWFTVSRGGRTLFEKRLQVEGQWSSSFIGTVAFMEAEGGYSGLYDALVSKLLADPDFQAAVAAPAER